ncbi:hypothetical protein T484DRAFT_1917091 [Baffinella frigidus]|nr:hypothetical protein T484DRAFT_1917091 [Cryptophyta sp. CCMP2293]
MDEADSDADFAIKSHQAGIYEKETGQHLYALLIFDPWTWAAPGWKVRPILREREDDTFILDFFGDLEPRKYKNVMDIPEAHFLSAFPAQRSRFLGFFFQEERAQAPSEETLAKLRTLLGDSVNGSRTFGLVWGKQPEYYKGREQIVEAVADEIPLISLLSPAQAQALRLHTHPRIRFVGHQPKAIWNALLTQVTLLLGIGDPLIGPSALDAVRAGAMYLNPTFPARRAGAYDYLSQHPYMAERVGAPTVCSYASSDPDSVRRCVKTAIQNKAPAGEGGHTPADFSRSAYIARFRDIFIDRVPLPPKVVAPSVDGGMGNPGGVSAETDAAASAAPREIVGVSAGAAPAEAALKALVGLGGTPKSVDAARKATPQPIADAAREGTPLPIADAADVAREATPLPRRR